MLTSYDEILDRFTRCLFLYLGASELLASTNFLTIKNFARERGKFQRDILISLFENCGCRIWFMIWKYGEEREYLSLPLNTCDSV